MYTHSKQIVIAGSPLAQAKGALVMLHGRGGSAEDMISLSRSLAVKELAIYAPQATNHSWYPYSFMVPQEENQPALDSALNVISDVVDEILLGGIPAGKIYFAGFSQGACLTLEFLARNARPYAGAVAFTGGLIGKNLQTANYKGNFNGSPILITTGDPDAHVPVSRVEQSAQILKDSGADVISKIYPGRPHTILADEIKLANQYIFK